MKIYISHSKQLMDFENNLYKPFLDSDIAKENTLILPHHKSEESFNIRELIHSKKIDLVIAEVSYPATGQGIELGWADDYQIPILCISQKGSKIAGSLKVITTDFIEYSDSGDMINKIQKYLESK